MPDKRRTAIVQPDPDCYPAMNHAALLQFFVNQRRFMRSRIGRQEKSPRELMTGQQHPHWFTLLGLGELQPLRG